MKVYYIEVDFLRRCQCAARQEAQREQRFFYATAHAGYAWRDSEGVPRRKDNRPFTWVTCPFCGGDLEVD